MLRRVNFRLFTKVNYYLMYSAWSQIVAMFDWFFGSTFRVYHGGADKEGELIFTGHNIFLANHGYELDWLGAWLVTEKYGQLASCKAMLKSDLKYLPVVGWSWTLSDQLFLDRNWEKDKHKLNSSIDTLLRYEPMVATFFCEGTRFTKDTIKASQQFAQERGLIAPKYHLIPRTKGFVAVVKHLKQRQRLEPGLKVHIYNAEIAFDETGAMNLADLLDKGLYPKGHLYFERFSIDDVPDNDEACAKWLHDLFLKKDELQEYFQQNTKFPGKVDKKFVDYKPRISSLLNWLLWQLYTLVSIAYLLIRFYINYGTFIVSLTMSIFFLLSYLYLNYIMYQADVSEAEGCGTKKSK